MKPRSFASITVRLSFACLIVFAFLTPLAGSALTGVAQAAQSPKLNTGADPVAAIASASPLPVLYIEDQTVNLHGRTTFQVPVKLNSNGLELSAVGFMVQWNAPCVTFDSVTDGDNDGVPDAVTGLPAEFDVSFVAAHDSVTLLIKPEAKDKKDKKDLPLLPGDIATLEFGAQNCVTTNGELITVNFTFPVATSPAVPSFGNNKGKAVDGTTDDGVYTLRFNAAPTDIILSPSSVAENLPAGTVVGAFSTADLDLDLGDSHTYAFATSCEQSSGNVAFSIQGSQLKTKGVLDYESQATYTVCVRTTDAYGLFYDKSLVVAVTDVPEAPVGILLSSTHVTETQPAGTTVGEIEIVDLDGGGTFTLTLPAELDNSAFVIEGNLLKTAIPLNAESKSSYNIKIRAQDSAGFTFEAIFTIIVDDINDVPVANDDPPVPTVIVGGQTAIIDVLANDTDEDSGDTLTVADVAPGLHVSVTNQITQVAVTAQSGFNGPDSFTYHATDGIASSNPATVTVHVVRDDVRADCNADGKIDAADFPATVLEIFDTDDEIAWWKTYSGEFAGSPRGCDSNGSENGLSGEEDSVGASDIICTVLIFFGDTSCSDGGFVGAASATQATLNAGSGMVVAAGNRVAVPLVLDTGGYRVAAATFALRFDPEHFTFDNVDANGDGVADTVSINAPAGMSALTYYDATAGSVKVALFGTRLPLPTLNNGLLATISLAATPTARGQSPIVLEQVSLGDDQGASVPVEAAGGVVSVTDPLVDGSQVPGQHIFLPIVKG